MKLPNNFLIILVSYFSLNICFTSVINTVYAAQESTIKGKVTDVITTDSFIYVEVEAEEKKVWAAGPVKAIKKGDIVAFDTTMPMRNFYSRALGRNFVLIYFTNDYITFKEASATSSSATQSKQQKITEPSTIQIAATASEVEIGGYLREVSLDNLNGHSKTFSDFKGKPLIINVWASWCGPCQSEMGALERLSHWNNGNDFNIIGISTDDYRDRAEAFIKKTGITFENFIDHKLVLEKMLGARTIPLTLLVGTDGRVLKKVRGAIEWDSPEIMNSIGKVFQIKMSKTGSLEPRSRLE